MREHENGYIWIEIKLKKEIMISLQTVDKVTVDSLFKI